MRDDDKTIFLFIGNLKIVVTTLLATYHQTVERTLENIVVNLWIQYAVFFSALWPHSAFVTIGYVQKYWIS